MKSVEQRGNRERKKHPADMLKSILAGHAKETNKRIETEYGLHDFLAPDATLDPKEYIDFYGEELCKADADFVRERELDFSSARIPNVRQFYRDKHGAHTEDEIITTWKENKSREKNGQMEMAITILLSQKLGKDFIVVRTAAYDDYKNSVDNLILDRVTGEVVGAFDEVHEGGDGRRTEEKKAKVRKIADRGGTRIRYGLKLSDGRLVRAGLENVPVFYLGLETAELVELVQGLGENDSKKTDKIFEKLVASLKAQHVELERNTTVPKLRSRLASFGQSLARLENTPERVAA